MIDIGCAEFGGDFSIERLVNEFAPDWLFGFDPHESVPEGKRAMMRDGKRIQVSTQRKAAWLYDGEIGYFSDGLNSKISNDYDWWPKVPCFDLAKYVVWRASQDADVVLKIDAEGAEYDLLDHLIEHRADALLRLAWIEWHPRLVHNPKQRRQEIEERIACELQEWLW